MVPIILIHGTAASSSTWEEPEPGLKVGTIPEDPSGTYDLSNRLTTLKDDRGTSQTLLNSPVVDRVSQELGPHPVTDLISSYPGPWFYKIDLGPAGRYEKDTDPGRAGKDRYINEMPDWNDSRGNASNVYAARQLRKLIPYVLEAYGLNGDGKWEDARCHVVAHSKGGSDCRWLVTQELYSEESKKKENKPFKVNGFYSLGTPFRGTPTADVAYAAQSLVKWVPFVDVRNGGASPVVVNSIADAANGILQAVAVGSAPKGAALADQRYQLDPGQQKAIKSRNISMEDWNDFMRAGGKYFSVAGDADIDGDEIIISEESKVMAPFLIKFLGGNGKLSSTYRMLATASENLQLFSYVEPLATYPYPRFRNRMVVTAGQPFDAWMPNDLVTTHRSALPPEWEGQANRRLTFRHDLLKAFEIRRQRRGGSLPDLDPGNHSMLKNATSLMGIISHLKTQYPVTP